MPPQNTSVYLLGLLGLVEGNAPSRTPCLLATLLGLRPLLLRPRLRLLEAGLGGRERERESGRRKSGRRESERRKSERREREGGGQGSWEDVWG